jgi:hypothetical protein
MIATFALQIGVVMKGIDIVFAQIDEFHSPASPLPPLLPCG